MSGRRAVTLPILKLLEEPTLAPPNNLLMTGELHFFQELEYVFLHARDGVCKRAVGNVNSFPLKKSSPKVDNISGSEVVEKEEEEKEEEEEKKGKKERKMKMT